MKTVLFLTDCSFESAAALRSWRRRHGPADWHVTVVFPIPAADRVTRTLSEHKARKLFLLWQQLVEEEDPMGLLCISEPGDPDDVVNSWLATEAYDHLLIEDRYCGLTYTTSGRLNQVDSVLLVSQMAGPKSIGTLSPL